jgi:hypothetical protein
MSIPGFTAKAHFHSNDRYYTAVTVNALLGEMKVIPQQECFTWSGKCTGFWPWYQGTQCVTGPSGTQQCCTNASTYPAIRECQNPDGTWRAVNQYCGYCWW